MPSGPYDFSASAMIWVQNLFFSCLPGLFPAGREERMTAPGSRSGLCKKGLQTLDFVI